MKNFNIFVLLILLFFIIFTVIFNYIIDTFDIFKFVKKAGFNYNKPCISKQERMTKIPQLKLYKDKIDYIFVGSSKTDWWLNPRYHSKISEKNVYSMALSSSSIQESIIMAENSVLIHPEIKRVYFGLDFFSFSSNFYTTAVNIEKISDKNLTKKEVMPLLLSFDTLQYSIKTLFTNLKQKTIQDTDLDDTVQINPKAEHYFKSTIKKYDRDYYSDYALNKEAFEELVEFSDFAKTNNVEVVYFVTPTHIIDIINLKEHGLEDEYYEFKKLLADYFDYYDLSLISEYNTEAVSKDMKYFRDAVHATKYLGTIFAENFYIKPNNSAAFITKNNVEAYIKSDKQNLNNYISENPEVVKRVKEWID